MSIVTYRNNKHLHYYENYFVNMTDINSMDLNETQDTGGYRSFRDDPVGQLCFLDKYVRVELIKSCSFDGFVHALDPITNSIILSIHEDGRFKTTVIPGHALLNITIQTTPSGIVPPSKTSRSASQNDLLQRKQKLMEWLKSNLLPVIEDDDKIVIGNVRILPPYSVLDICTDSPVVAMQIKKLVENMHEGDTG